MKVKHIKSGQEETITKEAWAAIVENGHASEFQILDEAPMPKEVSDRIKDPKSTN